MIFIQKRLTTLLLSLKVGHIAKEMFGSIFHMRTINVSIIFLINVPYWLNCRHFKPQISAADIFDFSPPNLGNRDHFYISSLTKAHI